MSKDATTSAPPVTEYATSADGTRIAFERDGDGPVLLLVDGALCYRDFGPARPVTAALRDRFTVVSYDRRGRGASGDTAPYAAVRELEDLAAVATSINADYVLGQSSGAALAYRAAAAGLIAPTKLAGYEAPYVGAHPDKKGKPRDYVGDLKALLAEGRNDKAVDYFMVTMVEGPWFLPLMMRTMGKNWTKLKAVATTLPNDATVMGDWSVPVDEFARISVPTLVMGGSKSAAPMAEAQVRIAATIPGAQHRVLAGQTHNVSPAALRTEVVPFFLG